MAYIPGAMQDLIEQTASYGGHCFWSKIPVFYALQAQRRNKRQYQTT